MSDAKVKLVCDWCGKSFFRYRSTVKGKKHVFCSRRCLWDFSSKAKNPEKYDTVKNLGPVSERMSRLNRSLNPTRMTNETKEKLRLARYGSGQGKTYAKQYGRHEHRVVAEQILGRQLLPGETVHHLDFNPRNNDPANLMVFSSQADHARYHALLDSFFLGKTMTEEWKVKEVRPVEVRAT